jgi:hypothetical protein
MTKPIFFLAEAETQLTQPRPGVKIDLVGRMAKLKTNDDELKTN